MWAKTKMAGFKAPRYVEFLHALPLNATGKVMKDQLKLRVKPKPLMILTPSAQDASIWDN
jgi:acyl-coenzyme A synthetase/AMP-(fatty) acid ligase